MDGPEGVYEGEEGISNKIFVQNFFLIILLNIALGEEEEYHTGNGDAGNMDTDMGQFEDADPEH